MFHVLACDLRIKYVVNFFKLYMCLLVFSCCFFVCLSSLSSHDVIIMCLIYECIHLLASLFHQCDKKLLLVLDNDCWLCCILFR